MIQVRARGVIEALLFAQVLEPLVKPLGSAGELTLTTVAQQIFAPKDA